MYLGWRPCQTRGTHPASKKSGGGARYIELKYDGILVLLATLVFLVYMLKTLIMFDCIERDCRQA